MQCKNIFFSFVVSLFFLNSAQASRDDAGEEKLKTPTFCPSSQIEVPTALLQECLKESSDFFQATTIKFAGYVFSLFLEASDEKSCQIFLAKDASRKALFYPDVSRDRQESLVWFHRGAWGLTFYISAQKDFSESDEDFGSQEKTYTFYPGAQIQVPLSLLRSYLKGVQYPQNNLTSLGVRGFSLCVEGDGNLVSFDKIYRNRMHRNILFYPSFDHEKAAQGSWFCIATSSLTFYINKEKF